MTVMSDMLHMVLLRYNCATIYAVDTMTWHLHSAAFNLLGELKRRGVYAVIVAYAIAAWMLLQIGEVTFAPLGLPDWTMTVLVIAAIAGFPVVIAIAWFFNITPHGFERDPGANALAHATEVLRPSIAVLPFIDLSPEQDQGYFCEGIAEEILNALTKIPNLHVVARSSSFQFRGGSGDVREIGSSLGVNSILEGSVRKFRDRIRVTAQLVSVKDGYHIWSRSFDEQMQDIFAIQDEIATGIAKHLLETMTPKQASAIRTSSTSDITAYDYYLRGRQFFNRFNKNDMEFAREMFHHAIKIDPDFALAWSGYADCYSFLIMYADPKPGYREQADAASKRALEIDPGLAEAHASRGLACLVLEQYGCAETEFEKALKLNSQLFEAYYYYGRARFHQGDNEGAAEWFRKAALSNPADYQSRMLRVQILRGMGRRSEAITEAKAAIKVAEKHLEWNPDDTRALHLGAGSLIVMGDFDRAKRWLQRALEIDPDDSVLLYNVACNYATLGEIDAALNYLEQAVEKGIVSISWMQNDADLARLREHPRYRLLLERLRQKLPVSSSTGQ